MPACRIEAEVQSKKGRSVSFDMRERILTDFYGAASCKLGKLILTREGAERDGPRDGQAAGKRYIGGEAPNLQAAWEGKERGDEKEEKKGSRNRDGQLLSLCV